MLAMDFYNGMRLGEIVRLKWHQLKFSDVENKSRIELSAAPSATIRLLRRARAFTCLECCLHDRISMCTWLELA
jgi:integrase